MRDWKGFSVEGVLNNSLLWILTSCNDELGFTRCQKELRCHFTWFSNVFKFVRVKLSNTYGNVYIKYRKPLVCISWHLRKISNQICPTYQWCWKQFQISLVIVCLPLTITFVFFHTHLLTSTLRVCFKFFPLFQNGESEVCTSSPVHIERTSRTSVTSLQTIVQVDHENIIRYTCKFLLVVWYLATN